MTLDAAEFLRRFLLHLLPASFVRIRHYGLLANRHRAANLARCRALLGEAAARTVEEPLPEPAAEKEPQEAAESPCCPVCGSRMRVVECGSRPTGRQLLSLPWPWDTS